MLYYYYYYRQNLYVIIDKTLSFGGPFLVLAMQRGCSDLYFFEILIQMKPCSGRWTNRSSHGCLSQTLGENEHNVSCKKLGSVAWFYRFRSTLLIASQCAMSFGDSRSHFLWMNPYMVFMYIPDVYGCDLCQSSFWATLLPYIAIFCSLVAEVSPGRTTRLSYGFMVLKTVYWIIYVWHWYIQLTNIGSKAFQAYFNKWSIILWALRSGILNLCNFP